MRNFLFGFFVIVMTCSFYKWETIKGNGIVKTDTREIKYFTGVKLSGNMNLEVEYGKGNELTVEGDENLLPYVETSVKDGILVIGTKDNVNLRSKNKIIIHARTPVLNQVTLSGSGNIKSRGNFVNNEITTLTLSGSGDIDMQVKSAQQTKLKVSGSGNIKLSGESATDVNAMVSGSGDIDCSALKCDNVVAGISGSGNIKVTVNKSINASISGSGNVYYNGAATQINTKSMGSGKVIKM